MPDCSDYEIKAEILNRLMRRGCWGGKYLPLESLVHWLSKKVKRDGKRVRRLIKELAKERYILLHKGGKTISLNPASNRGLYDIPPRSLENGKKDLNRLLSYK